MQLSDVLSRLPVQSIGAERVGGGCIADAYRVEAEVGVFFLKLGGSDVARTFAAEAAGLRLLKSARSPLHVPEIIACEETGPGGGFLLLEWIASGAMTPDAWERLGHGLAALHRVAGPSYGAPFNNFIGRTPQSNEPSESWIDFFREQRLQPQAERARRAGKWLSGWDAPMDRLYAALHKDLPRRPEASLLHGDLWSGNFMVTEEGTPTLIDPAAYYGHRETDLALTELFGGFDKRFYDAYNEAWPLDGAYEERKSIYNLYHLLNHLNLFGGSYQASVDAVLRQF